MEVIKQDVSRLVLGTAEVGRALRIACPSVSHCIERGKILLDAEPEMYK